MSQHVFEFILFLIVSINVVVFLFGDIFVTRFLLHVPIAVGPSYINLIFLVNEENITNNPDADKETGHRGNQKCPWHHRSCLFAILCEEVVADAYDRNEKSEYQEDIDPEINWVEIFVGAYNVKRENLSNKRVDHESTPSDNHALRSATGAAR